MSKLDKKQLMLGARMDVLGQYCTTNIGLKTHACHSWHRKTNIHHIQDLRHFWRQVAVTYFTDIEGGEATFLYLSRSLVFGRAAESHKSADIGVDMDCGVKNFDQGAYI